MLKSIPGALVLFVLHAFWTICAIPENVPFVAIRCDNTNEKLDVIDQESFDVKGVGECLQRVLFKNFDGSYPTVYIYDIPELSMESIRGEKHHKFLLKVRESLETAQTLCFSSVSSNQHIVENMLAYLKSYGEYCTIPSDGYIKTLDDALSVTKAKHSPMAYFSGLEDSKNALVIRPSDEKHAVDIFEHFHSPTTQYTRPCCMIITSSYPASKLIDVKACAMKRHEGPSDQKFKSGQIPDGIFRKYRFVNNTLLTIGFLSLPAIGIPALGILFLTRIQPNKFK